jgi:zinc protease
MRRPIMQTKINALRAAAALALAFLAGCATTGPTSTSAAAAGAAPSALGAMGDAFGSGGLSPFAAENLSSISVFSLSNGIPVVVKRTTANRVLALSLVLRGGAAAATPDTAGLESLALATMARGSAGHSYEEIQGLLDETSSGLGRSVNLDFSSYSLVTLDKYFARLLPLWADTLVRPAFAKKDFDQVLSEARLALQSKAQDPWATASLETNAVFFAGHPYAATPEGTEESLARASLDAVVEWHSTAFSANRMFVVAVGDFDPAALRGQLEAGIGSIPDRGYPLPPAPPGFPVGGGLGTLTRREFPQSRGIAYLRGDFAAPGPDDPDFMAMNVGMRMLADLLLNVVRDKYGAVYSPGAYIRDSVANYGSIVVYKTKVAGRVKSYVDEAVAELAAGKVLSVDPSAAEGARPRTTIEEALPSYKAKYVNDLFEGQSTNAQVAARIARSIVSSGDCRSWLLDFDRIGAVTADQVRSALRKYLFEGRVRWVALGSADAILPVVDMDFEGFASY